jgi:cyclase
VVNTPVFGDKDFIVSLAAEFGKQCVVAALDLKRSPKGGYVLMVENGTKTVEGDVKSLLEGLKKLPVGEIYLNSMDRDGTGQGYDFNILELLPKDLTVPVIMAGGVGNSRHIAEGFNKDGVDATATAHLFNFIGNGLEKSRAELIIEGFNLAQWPSKEVI